MHEDERERERWVGRERGGGRVYINKPREKAPKIIPARRNKSGDAQGEKRDAERAERESSRVVPKRRLTGWVLGSKLN